MSASSLQHLPGVWRQGLGFLLLGTGPDDRQGRERERSGCMTRAVSFGVRGGMAVDKEHRAEVVHLGWMAQTIASCLF